MEVRNTAVLKGRQITMTNTTVRQYNNLVDQILVTIPTENDGITLSDYNVFIKTRNRGFVNKITLTEETTIGNYIWSLTATDTKNSGTLEFEIQLEHKTDPAIPIWQSDICTSINILSNIPPVEEVDSDAVGVLSQLYQELTGYNETADEDATIATTKASEALTSASNAATSATASATSATASATSEINAKESETNAALSETNAALSETNAALSASTATTDATTATTKANEASTSATSAQASATNAATSETNAAASATSIADSAAQINTNTIDVATNTENIETLQYDTCKRYGVKINTLDSDPDTRCEYVFDAVGLTPACMDFTNGIFDYGDFGDNWMVTGNYPVMLKYDGTIDYKLNPNDYSKKEDGTDSDYNNIEYTGNVMARIPKAYLANYTVGDYQYIVFCKYKYDDNYNAYPFTKENGTIMDCFYSSVYRGYNDGTRMRSLSGYQPTTALNGTTERTLAQANGDLWDTKTWAQRNHINCLLILLGKSTNTQAVYGQGNSTGYDAGSETKGILQTGMLDQSGQFWGSSATTSQVKIFHIESYWGDVWDRIAGLMMKDGTIRAKMTPPYNTTADGYADTGISPTDTSGSYIKACASDPVFGILPNSTGGSSSTYFPDYFYYSETATTYALVGGDCSYGSTCGGSALNLYHGVSNAYWSIGSSLSCEQPN